MDGLLDMKKRTVAFRNFAIARKKLSERIPFTLASLTLYHTLKVTAAHLTTEPFPFPYVSPTL
jgi:hypothetical protein